MIDEDSRPREPVWGPGSHALIEVVRFLAIGGWLRMSSCLARPARLHHALRGCGCAGLHGRHGVRVLPVPEAAFRWKRRAQVALVYPFRAGESTRRWTSVGCQFADGAAGATGARLGLPPIRSHTLCRRRGARDIELFPAQARSVRLSVALCNELCDVDKAFARPAVHP